MTNLLDQLRYNHWANLRLMDATSELDKDRFIKNMDSSFPSVQETWIHIIWAEELWLHRWQGRTFTTELSTEDYTNIESIRKNLENLAAKQFQILERCNRGDENKMISYENFQGKKWEYSLRQMVQHMVFHSVYHRGQITTLLRQLGVIPPGLDYLIYVDESSLIV
jgi:uncharacterized damage-inducible protein DinB